MNDLISRQAAIDALRNEENHAFNSYYRGLVKAHKIITDLPPVTPQPKIGHWIMENMSDGDVGYRCSECNELFWLECGTPKDNRYNFCPKCGERLIEQQESGV